MIAAQGRALIVATYAAIAAAYVYGYLETEIGFGSDVVNWGVISLLALVHVAAGAVIGRWWAVALPLVLPLLALPAGFSPRRGLEAPLWLVLAAVVPLAAALTALGVGGSRVCARGSVQLKSFELLSK